MPHTASEDPTRLNDLSDKAAPIVVKSYTESEDPTRAKDRNATAAPM
jgi:hypothetical protein